MLDCLFWIICLIMLCTCLFAGAARAENASIRWKDGTYTGDLRSGIPHGVGSILWDAGETYEGSWRDGAVTGNG